LLAVLLCAGLLSAQPVERERRFNLTTPLARPPVDAPLGKLQRHGPGHTSVALAAAFGARSGSLSGGSTGALHGGGGQRDEEGYWQKTLSLRYTAIGLQDILEVRVTCVYVCVLCNPALG
jgi:hypothetical protein